jgi:hypothetical protein
MKIVNAINVCTMKEKAMNNEKTTKVLFNRNPLVIGGSIEQPPTNELKNTFGLWNASLDDAVRYGGEITRLALRAMNIRHDRKHVIVDTKIHMLMKGMSPAIPGWHTDGAPRDNTKNPGGSGKPDIFAQENDPRPNRYHLLVTGTGCLTKFVNSPLYVPIPSEPSYEVYNMMSQYVQDLTSKPVFRTMTVPSATVVEFDWWDIHTGVVASANEWRYLIRVAESDYYQPRSDLREIIRMQSQVYAPTNFSW